MFPQQEENGRESPLISGFEQQTTNCSLAKSDNDNCGGGDKENKSFLKFFFQSKGPPHVVLLCLLLALALGSTIGVVPAVMTDRYARINHGFDGDNCASYSNVEKPHECIQGSSDAQNASAIQSLISNILTFLTSSLVGSISDTRGRKGILSLGIFLSLLAPFSLVTIQLNKSMSPSWYYGVGCSTGLVNWIAVALSSLSDVMPQQWRAPSFGLLLAGFSCGFALSPMLALSMSHLGVSIMAFSLLVGGFLFTVFCMPETLSKEISETALQMRNEKYTDGDWKRRVGKALMRPMRELSILNRSRLFRILSTLAFFSGMVSSADQTLLLYYLEEQFNFNDKDISMMFLIIGILGILVQSVLLKPLNDLIGERYVLIVAFSFGTLTNFLYGVLKSKSAVFVAIVISSFSGMSFPTISAIKSNNVDELEQGRIQGALYSLSSLASAIGPLSLRFVYHQTKDYQYPGPGTMYIFAALLLSIATFFACSLPKDQANSAATYKYLEEEEKNSQECCSGGTSVGYGSTDSLDSSEEEVVV